MERVARIVVMWELGKYSLGNGVDRMWLCGGIIKATTDVALWWNNKSDDRVWPCDGIIKATTGRRSVIE